MSELKLFEELPELERIDSPDGRTYRTPSGAIYPSASTVVGYASDHSYIDEWRQNVGESVADDITDRAARRGTLIHENIENFILGKPQTFNMFQHEERQMFRNVLSFVSELEEVYCLETKMWSDSLKVAGTVDMIGKHRGEKKVIDWKTSRRYKTREEIPGYFMQAAAYAGMVFERYNTICKTLCIVITTQDDGVLVYEEKTMDWLPKFAQAREKYRLEKGI